MSAEMLWEWTSLVVAAWSLLAAIVVPPLAVVWVWRGGLARYDEEDDE